jgi:hypothetical protein
MPQVQSSLAAPRAAGGDAYVDLGAILANSAAADQPADRRSA